MRRHLPEYLIHIGPHKTGTTYLQGSFVKMRSFLSEAGIFYPSHWQDGPGHFDLFRRLKTLDQSLRSEFAELNQTPSKTVLLSAEDLCGLPKESIEYLSQCIDGRQTTVVGYCRRWSELLASEWQETVKHGGFLTFAECVADHMINIHASKILNYDRILKPYADVFGKANLRLVSYSHLMDRGEDILSHFFASFLQITETPQHERVILNASMGVLESELVRSLNALAWAAGEPPSVRAYRAYVQVKPKLELQKVFHAMERAKRRLRMNEGAPSLQALHQQLAQEYRSAMVLPRPPELLFEPRIAELPYIRSEYLICDDVMARLRELREQLNLTESALTI
jgi:hypothetical protein